MSAPAEPRFPRRGIHRFVSQYLESLQDLSGRVVVDIPCGDGRASAIFRRKGADVRPLDLYPEGLRVPGLVAIRADMTETLPLPDASADLVLCQEGIEHVPDQMHLLAELNRILKPGGRLILTTPCLSHVRARLAQFFFESDSWRRMPPNELEGVLMAGSSVEQVYYGHLFLRGVQHLRAICSLSGFRVRRRLRTDVALSSVVFGVLLYPLLVLATLATAAMHRAKQSRGDDAAREEIWSEQVRFNLSPTTLFCKHVLWELEKVASIPERRGQILASGIGIGPFRRSA